MAICQMLGQVPMSVQAVEIRRRGCFRNMLQILAAAVVGALMPTVGFFGGSSKSPPCPPPLGWNQNAV